MSKHYAKLRLHTFDDFDPPHPSTFRQVRIPWGQRGALREWWVPQTIGDQIWVFSEFADEAARDRYMDLARRALAEHVTSAIGHVCSRVEVPDADEVRHWCTDGDYVRWP